MKFMSFQSWLAQTIADDGCCQSEAVSYLWADPSQEDVLDYFATYFDLDTIRAEDVQAAADEIYQKTQAIIASDFPDEIQVWRCGELAGDVTSVTTNKGVATRGCGSGYYGGKDAAVTSYMVNRSDVLVSIEHLWPFGDFVEDELLVRPSSLRPMKESLLRACIRELLTERDVIAIGKCFPFAHEMAQKWWKDHIDRTKPRSKGIHPDLDNKDKFKVAHGTVTNKWHDPPKAVVHAWVEMGDMIFDDQTKITKPDGIPRNVYYDMFQPEIRNEYTAEETLSMCSKTGSPGPWDEESLGYMTQRDAWLLEKLR